MTNSFSIELYLDVRYMKKEGLDKANVKLKVYQPRTRKRNYIKTEHYLTESEFHQILTKENRDTTKTKSLRNKLNSELRKAEALAEKIIPFSFNELKKSFKLADVDSNNIAFQYEKAISDRLEKKRMGNAEVFKCAKNSFVKFTDGNSKDKNGNLIEDKFKRLKLNNITPKWLQDYEDFIVNQNGSLTTVSIYLRTLRTILNKALKNGDIHKAEFPFKTAQDDEGEKYVIPNPQGVKKALNKEQLKVLLNSQPKTADQQKALDFWFFSFVCNGMNIKDIALLKFKDIQDGVFSFYRAKTKLTSKNQMKPVKVYLNSFSNGIISKYANSNEQPDNYVFDILRKGLRPEQERNRIKNFTRYINQHLKKHCKNIGLPEEISTYWARHSYATNAVNKGASLEFVSEALGHKNLKTTIGYFAGFDSETKKQFSEDVLNFDY